MKNKFELITKYYSTGNIMVETPVINGNIIHGLERWFEENGMLWKNEV